MLRKVLVILVFTRRQLLFVIGLLATASLFVGTMVYWPIVPPDLEGRVIVIDPGHGGIDSGSSHGSLYEKDLTLLYGRVAAGALEAAGATVVLTRNTDTDLIDTVSVEEEIRISREEYVLDIQEGRRTDALDRGVAIGTRNPPAYRRGLRARLLMAEEQQAEIFISIHTNRFRSQSPEGAITLYQPDCPESKRLAQAIQAHLRVLMPGRSQPDVIADNFFILRRSKIPTVIVEIGFISNDDDRNFMMSEAGQDAIASAVVDGVKAFYANLPGISER